MKRLLTIFLILSSVASFSQSRQEFVKDSTIFRPQTTDGAIVYTRGVQYADTFRIVPRDTTWQPLRVGTATTPDGISLYMWDGTKWNGVSGGGGGGVSSVGLTMPTGFSVANSPVTSSGTLAVTTTLNGILQGDGANTIGVVTIGTGLTYSAPTLSTTAWNITGNSNTTSATNFIGTTNAQGLRFRVGNTDAGWIDNSILRNLSFGKGSFGQSVSGSSNVAFGSNTMPVLTSGEANIAVGSNTMREITIGGANIAIGGASLDNISEGQGNTAVGVTSLNKLGRDNGGLGDNNTALGIYALFSLVEGNHNIGVGREAGGSADSLVGDNNIAIGYRSAFYDDTASNQLNIQNIIYGVENQGTDYQISTGRIGIGIPTPEYKLDIAGDLRIQTIDDGTEGVDSILVSDGGVVKKISPSGGGGGSVNVYAPLVKSNDSISQRFNVNSYGATGNGVALYSVAMTSSDATLTSAEANFVSGDIGKTIVVVGASSSNQDLITTIASINSTTSVELSVPAATTVSGQLAVYGEDQTTFIQAAINACNSAGGGKVIIPNGIYVIAGALQTSVGGLNMNSQIYIPAPPSAIDSNRTHIIIEGEAPPNYLQYNGLSSDNANTFKGTILVSISQSGGNGAAVIGTRGENTVWGDFNYTYLTVNNLTIKVLPNPAGDGVRMGGISYRYGASLTVDQVLVNSMGNPSLGVMPSSSGVIGGIETPENNSEPRNYITNSMVSGFPNGFILGEHVTIIESQAQVCYNGFRLKDGYHKSTGIRLGSFWCKNNIYVAATVANLSQWDIDLDVEWLDNGRWYATENTISDSANRLQGTLRYTIIESGVGFNNSKFVADGADNVTKISTSSGNYGINTISPTASLHVTGTGIFSDTLTATTMGDSDSSHRVASTAWVKRQGYGSGGGGITGSGVADKITYWTGTSSIDDAGTLNWDNTNSRLGIGSITPTHSFELDSAMAVGINTTSVANKGIKLWSSTDKTTNTSGMRMYMGSAANNYDGYIMVFPEATGTRTSFASNLHLNHTNTYVGYNGEVFAPAATFSGQVNTLLTLASSYMAASTYEPYAGNNNALNLAAFNVSNSSSADQVGIILAPQNQQTGTAQYHAVRIAPYYNTFSSSGAQTLFEVGERANATPTSTFTGLFSIDRAGLVNIVNTPSGAATDSILTIDGSGNVHKRNIYAVGYSEASIASSATPSPTGSARENWLDITALAVGATFAAPSGTPVNHNQLIIRVEDNGGAQTLAWNAIYRAGTNLALPTTTTAGKEMYIKFYYNSTATAWDLVSVLDGL